MTAIKHPLTLYLAIGVVLAFVFGIEDMRAPIGMLIALAALAIALLICRRIQ